MVMVLDLVMIFGAGVGGTRLLCGSHGNNTYFMI